MIEKYLKSVGFTFPVFIDSRADILFLNDIPENTPLLHTFMIDQDNKIVLLGSPLSTSKMTELYIKQIQAID